MTDFEKKIKKLQRRKTIYIVVASLLILLNLLTDLLSFIEGEFARVYNEQGYGIGYMIGSHIFAIFGLFLLYRVFKINKRIKDFKKQQFEIVIDSVGSDLLNE